MPFLEEVAMDRQRDRQIGARTHGQVNVSLFCERRRPRVDDYQSGAAAFRLADIGQKMNAGSRRVGAPYDDDFASAKSS